MCQTNITGSNNARAERINGAIEELKRIGRGYRNKQNFRTAILFFHGDLNGFSHKTQQNLFLKLQPCLLERQLYE